MKQDLTLDEVDLLSESLALVDRQYAGASLRVPEISEIVESLKSIYPPETPAKEIETQAASTRIQIEHQATEFKLKSERILNLRYKLLQWRDAMLAEWTPERKSTRKRARKEDTDE